MDDNRGRHEVQTTLAEDDGGAFRLVLDVSINADWSDIAADLDQHNATIDDAAVVIDAEQCPVAAFTGETWERQRDFAHVSRSFRHRLSVDGALGPEAPKGTITEANGMLSHVRNLAEKRHLICYLNAVFDG
ncbi:hypothetical protein [Halovenus salina]|uniref:hypothetical protein n=1 Tax=Halovenus salina TaxID=1510225 RepID=UPI0022609DB5|nr:hypothetical protein [Halovenus salina]